MPNILKGSGSLQIVAVDFSSSNLVQPISYSAISVHFDYTQNISDSRHLNRKRRGGGRDFQHTGVKLASFPGSLGRNN